MEFLLVAPLLILVFFAILQLAYLGVTALAVQHAALAVAREASLSADEVLEPAAGLGTRVQEYAALLPLTALNPKAYWAALSCADCRITHDSLTVTATVRFPMPIWVPGVGRWFGEPLAMPPGPEGAGIPGIPRDILRLLGLPDAAPSFAGARLPFVRWMHFTATVHKEGAVR